MSGPKGRYATNYKKSFTFFSCVKAVALTSEKQKHKNLYICFFNSNTEFWNGSHTKCMRTRTVCRNWIYKFYWLGSTILVINRFCSLWLFIIVVLVAPDDYKAKIFIIMVIISRWYEWAWRYCTPRARYNRAQLPALFVFHHFLSLGLINNYSC